MQHDAAQPSYYIATASAIFCRSTASFYLFRAFLFVGFAGSGLDWGGLDFIPPRFFMAMILHNETVGN